MCLIIHKPKNLQAIIDRGMLQSGTQRNSDGWGIMYAVPGENRIQVVRGMEASELFKRVEILEKDSNIDLFIHLRMKTHGTVSHENTHPFSIGNSGALLMHNGIINGIPLEGDDSDTAALCKSIAPLLENDIECIFTPVFKYWINLAVTTDRVIILLPDGRFAKFGTGVWNVYKGLNLSNTYAWSYPVTTYKAPTYTAPAALPAEVTTTADSVINNWEGERDYLPSEFFEPSEDAAPITNLNYLDYLLEDPMDNDNDETSLEQLSQMTYEQLEEAIWRNPDIAVKAIYQAAIHLMLT
jgi:hypothetical protein